MPLVKRLPLTIFEIHTFEIISLTLILHYFLIYSSQARLSMSIMHHWRGVAVQISLLRGTGFILPSVSDPLIIVWVGSFSSFCIISDHLPIPKLVLGCVELSLFTHYFYCLLLSK